MRDIIPELNGKDYIDELHKDYDIRFCRVDEYEELVDFLRRFWKEDHIFVLSKQVLDFQHLDRENQRYNYVIAKEKNSGEIHSILGFVPSSHYDKNIEKKLVWPCIWKSRDDVHRKGLGVALYHYLKTTLKIDTIAILGISEIALSIYKHWNFKTGKIEQYFLPASEIKNILSSGLESLEKIEEKNVADDLQVVEYTQEMFEQIPEDDEVFTVFKKYKSKMYYVNRFFLHPVYEYKFYTFKSDEEIHSIMITRECGTSESKCLRIVDFIGDLERLSRVKNQLSELLDKNNYEYMDFIVTGVNSAYFDKAGFYNRRNYSDIIIPNYFEPFLKENIDLDYAYKTLDEDEEVVFFKADADQDRPNIID